MAFLLVLFSGALLAVEQLQAEISGSSGQQLDDTLSETSSIDTAILGELTASQQELRDLHRHMKEERKRDQEQAVAEKQRLEDILLMCAEYEKQMERETVTKDTGSLGDMKETRNSMTKIKTNGSLTKLASPTQFHKDVMFDYKWRRNSASSTEEDTGSENGTIKRRPLNGVHSPVSTLSASPNYDNALTEHYTGSATMLHTSGCRLDTTGSSTLSDTSTAAARVNGVMNGVDANSKPGDENSSAIHGDSCSYDWHSKTLPSSSRRTQQLAEMKAYDTSSLGRGVHLNSLTTANLLVSNVTNRDKSLIIWLLIYKALTAYGRMVFCACLVHCKLRPTQTHTHTQIYIYIYI